LAQAGFERRVASSFWGRVGAKVPLKDNQVQGFRILTLGFGLNRPSWALDYAYEPQGELGTSHRVSFKAALSSPLADQPATSTREKHQPTASPTPVLAVKPELTATPTSTPTRVVPSPTPTAILKEKADEKDRLKLFFELPDETPVPTPKSGAAVKIQVNFDELLGPAKIEKVLTPGVK
jgi:hypothetical protein